MKCIKDKKGNVRRVSNEKAAAEVKANKAVYVPKSEWKATGRN